MSSDMLRKVNKAWALELLGYKESTDKERALREALSESEAVVENKARDEGKDLDLSALALTLPHPDDPMMGIFVENLVDKGTFVNVDDRDWNLFSLNPTCEARFSMLHERTWVVEKFLVVMIL